MRYFISFLGNKVSNWLSRDPDLIIVVKQFRVSCKKFFAGVFLNSVYESLGSSGNQGVGASINERKKLQWKGRNRACIALIEKKQRFHFGWLIAGPLLLVKTCEVNFLMAASS